MLYMPKTAAFDSEEGVLSKSAVISAEGQALVAVADGLKQSEGTEGEVFAGFVMQRVSATPFLEDFYVACEELTVGTAGAVVLQRAPISAEVVGAVAEDGTAITGITVEGSTVKSDALTEGMNVKVTYKYAMSVVEAKSRLGDVQPGGPAGALVGQIGIVSRGTVYTNCFDPAIDWKTAKTLNLGANGMITSGGNGVEIKGYVVEAPSTMYPFLGIKFSAA